MASPGRAGRGGARGLIHHRRHLPAGDQGPPRGAGPLQARPPGDPDRPCRPSRGGRHDGPIARGRGLAGQHVAEVAGLEVPEVGSLAYVTQTTLSVDDTREVVAALRSAFPASTCPPLEDICYATTNRQEAIKRAARLVEAVIVVGAANSSNSQRLREVAEREGRKIALLVADVSAIDWRCSRASPRSPSPPAPRRRKFWSSAFSTASPSGSSISVETLTTADEAMFFPLPRALRDAAGALSGGALQITLDEHLAEVRAVQQVYEPLRGALEPFHHGLAIAQLAVATRRRFRPAPAATARHGRRQ